MPNIDHLRVLGAREATAVDHLFCDRKGSTSCSMTGKQGCCMVSPPASARRNPSLSPRGLPAVGVEQDDPAVGFGKRLWGTYRDRKGLWQGSTERRSMIARILVQTSAWLAAMAAILFLAAGDWRWSEAWIFLAEVALLSFAVSFWLLVHDPALLASRLTSPVLRDQPRWDRIFMIAVMAAFIGWLVLIGLDARRFA
jgi:hypothetical protein